MARNGASAGYVIDPATGLPALQMASGALMPLPLSEDDMPLTGAPSAKGLQGRPARAGGGSYAIDPVTGMPTIMTRGGLAMPLPLSPDDMRLAGAQLAGPAGMPKVPAPVPGTLVAGPGGGPMAQWGNEIPTLPAPTPDEQQASQAQQVADMRAQLMPAATGNTHPSSEPSKFAMVGAPPVAAAPAANPAELAQHRGAPSQVASAGQAGGGLEGMDPAVEAVFRESLAGAGGGGGPRRLGVSSESAKFFRPGAVNPETAAAATEAQNAREGYDLAAAGLTDQRREQVYQAQQAEAAARAQAVEQQRQRYQEQQRQLADYQVKRDALASEAAQLKAPQMEDYWQSRGTFAKVMTGLSIALGGALQGLRGGTNPGLEMSNRAINQWLAEQRETYERARTRVNDADTQYGKLVQAFGSQNLAEAELRAQAYSVRDSMLQTYAQKVGTPAALELATQQQLKGEEERAKLRMQAEQQAGAEIEQKLTMQGGGGAGKPRLKKAISDAAETAKDLRTIRGEAEGAGRAVESGKTDTISGALQALDAADQVERLVMGYGDADDDTDDPRSGAYDYVTKNLPHTAAKKRGQDLDQATFQLARGAQLALGKSDNDAVLAGQQAVGLGGSKRERIQAAQQARRQFTAAVQDAVAGMTAEQRRTYMQGLEPERRARIEQVLRGRGQRFPAAASERPVD